MHAMMQQVSKLDMVYFEDPEYYNTLTRAHHNVWRIVDLFWQVTFFIGEVVSVAVISTALIAYDWRLVALVLVGTIPSIYLAMRWAEGLWSAFAEASPISRHANYYRDLLTYRPEAAKEIRLFGLQEHFLDKFSKLFTAFMRKQDKASAGQLRWYAVIALVEGGLSIFAAWLVVQSFLAGAITIGTLTFLWALLFQFASHARWTVRMIGDMNTHATFLTPLADVVHFKPTITDPPSPEQFPRRLSRGIEFRNVGFAYPRSKTKALHGVNLSIKPGESVALVGENGSGKTTLVKLLCRLYDVSEGDILIENAGIKNYRVRDLQDRIGVIFQDFMKYEAIVEENVRYGRLTLRGRDKVHAAAIKAGAWQFVRELEQEYKTQLGKQLKLIGVELSIGQWQKIALARAFYRDADILILDEPTAAVDAKAEYQLFQRFRRLTQGKTTILISHRFSTVRMADRIIVMHKGRIVEQGSHEELLRKNGRYATLFRLQAKGYR